MAAKKHNPMHVHRVRTTKNGKTYVTHLLRKSYREGGRVRKKTLATLSHLPPEIIDIIRESLKGKQYAPTTDTMPDPVSSSNHGNVEAVMKAIRLLGLDTIISSRRCRERDLVLAMVASRIINPGMSKSALARSWKNTTLAGELQLGEASAVELYNAMDWLGERQNRIQNKLARRYLDPSSPVMYDLTSTWMEGSNCPYSRHGYSRDGKRGKLQVNFGLLCDIRGRPVAVSVHDGNVPDSQAIGPEIDRLRKGFSLDRVVIIGDRGMIVQTTIDILRTLPGVDWITALKGATIRKLVRSGHLDAGDGRILFEMNHPDYPGERLVVCRNRSLATRRSHVREALLVKTEELLSEISERVARGTLEGAGAIGLAVGRVVNKHKVRKHFELEITETGFSWQRNREGIGREAAMDGIYVIRTSLAEKDLDAAGCVRSYKQLTQVERAFRTIKTSDLHVRPVYHWLEGRVRVHIFVCMLAYLVEWHMRKAWIPLLFADPELEDMNGSRNPVLPVKRSEVARGKMETGRLEDGSAVHSFRTLMDLMGTIVRNEHPLPGVEGQTFATTTVPDAKQVEALRLLDSIAGM